MGLKNQLVQINQKYETSLRYEAYMDSMEKLNKELTTKLSKKDEDIKKDLKLERDKYIIKMDKINQKTLDVICTMKKTSSQKAMNNTNNTMKVMSIQNCHLLNELNEHSMMIEELLHKIEAKESIIKELKFEINIQKELGRLITHQKLMMKKDVKDITERSNLNVLSTNMVTELNTISEKEKQTSKIVTLLHRNVDTNSTNTKTLTLKKPNSSSRNPYPTTLDTQLDNAAYQTLTSIRNIKTSTQFSKRIIKSDNNFFKPDDHEKQDGITNESDKNNVRNLKIFEKDENYSIERIKFLNKYKWYFDIIESFFNELKDHNLKFEWILEEGINSCDFL